MIVALSICVIAAVACDPAQNSSNWLFEAKSDSHGVSSCVSQNGGVNDLGNAPTMCEGDATSVRLEVQKGKAECLKAVAGECGIPMRNFVSLDYDFSISKCSGIWAAPLWMTPHVWQWGAASGEIDSLEFCPRTTVVMNFAGGGHQVALKCEYGQIRGTHHGKKGREWNRHDFVLQSNERAHRTMPGARVQQLPGLSFILGRISLVGATNPKIFMDQEDVRTVGIVYGRSCLIFGTG